MMRRPVDQSRPLRRLPALMLAALLCCTQLTGCTTIKEMFSDEKTTPPLPGERISVLQLQKELVPAEGLKDQAMQLPDPWVNKLWPQPGGYPNHALGHLALSAAPKEIWSASIGAGGDHRTPLTAAPVVAEGTVYTLDTQSELSAFNLADGKKKWHANIMPEAEKDKGAVGGGLSYASGRLFATNGYKFLLALDPTNGKPLWKAPLSAPARSPATIMDDRVYIVTLDNRLSVFNAADGSPLWSYTGIAQTTNLLGSASPAADSTLVILPMSSGELYGLRPENGQVAWEDNLSAIRNTGSLNSLSDIKGLPVIDQGIVYAVSFSGRMVALDQVSGQRLWQKEIGSAETPWAAGENVFVLTSEQQLVALTRSAGEIRWVTQLPRYEEQDREQPVVWAGPVLAGGRLITVSSDGRMYDIAPDSGKITGQDKISGQADLAPVVADQTMLILTKDGTLTAYR